MGNPLWHSDEEEKLRSFPGESTLPTALPESPAEEIRETFVVEEVSPTRSERVGNALGEAIGNLRSRLRFGMHVVAGKSKDAKGSLGEMGDSAQQKAREFSRDARIRMDELRRRAQRRMNEAREKTKRTVNERPLQSVLAVAGAAVVVGFLLRVWRSSRD